jgi:phage terminase large subunit
MAGRTEVITIPYAPRKQFLPLHNRKERFAATVAHRRAGKTVAEINDKIKSALTCQLPNPRTAYIAPFYKQAKAVAWTYAKQYGLVVPGAVPNESELRIDFPNGGQFRLYGADNPDALRGIYLDDVTMDEPADMNPRLWPEVIRPCLVDRKGRASFIGTPKGRNAFYQICEAAKKQPDWLFMILRASETGLIPAEEIAALKAMMTPEQFEQEFECSFEAAILGAYYGREMAECERTGRICKVAYDPSVKVYTVWDLGYSDDTAIWFFQVIRGEIHIIDYYFASGRDIDHYGELIKSKNYDYETHWLPHDAKAKTLASGGKSIEEQLSELLGWGCIRIVPRLSLEDGIQAARKMFPRIWFDIGCEEGIEALRQYQRQWDDERKCFRDAPYHNWTSHPADAFRYLAIAWEEEFTEGIAARRNADPYGDEDDEQDTWKTV